MLSGTHYAQNYASIIGWSLPLIRTVILHMFMVSMHNYSKYICKYICAAIIVQGNFNFISINLFLYNAVDYIVRRYHTYMLPFTIVYMIHYLSINNVKPYFSCFNIELFVSKKHDFVT